MKSMAGKSQNNKRFLDYLDENYIDKKYQSFLYQKHSRFLTKNLSESVNSQFSKFFYQRPKKNQWIEFLFYNEKRIIRRQVNLSIIVNNDNLDSYDTFLIDLQSRKFPSYKSYRRFMFRSQRKKELQRISRSTTDTSVGLKKDQQEN